MSKMAMASRLIWAAALGLFAGAAVMLGFRMTRADVEAEVYRERLQTLTMDYEALRAKFNDAVRRSAVTELLVKDGKLSVRVRSPLGVVEETPTPFDPKGEIYVDYVLVDGRLWIRRVFDASTPPSKGVVIDPKVETVDFSSPHVAHGKAIYRSLDEGRWIVTVTGSGALGLTKISDDVQVELVEAPPVHEFNEVAHEAEAKMAGVGIVDVWERLIGY